MYWNIFCVLSRLIILRIILCLSINVTHNLIMKPFCTPCAQFKVFRNLLRCRTGAQVYLLWDAISHFASKTFCGVHSIVYQLRLVCEYVCLYILYVLFFIDLMIHNESIHKLTWPNRYLRKCISRSNFVMLNVFCTFRRIVKL